MDLFDFAAGGACLWRDSGCAVMIDFLDILLFSRLFICIHDRFLVSLEKLIIELGLAVFSTFGF